LVVELHILRRESASELREKLGRVHIVTFVVCDHLLESDTYEQRRQLVEHLRVIRRPLLQGLRIAHQRSSIPARKVLCELHHMIPRDGAEHCTRGFLVDLAAAKRDELIEKRQAIAHAAIRRECNQPDSACVVLNSFGLKDVAHVLGDLRHRQALQIELQTP
jgi:hypothetical protein